MNSLSALLNEMPRALRGAIAIFIAVVLTGGVTAGLSGALYRLDPSQLSFFGGAINLENLNSITGIVLAASGLLFYVVGWSVLMGFSGDFKVGIAGALWVALGVLITVALIFTAIISTIAAVAES